VKLSTSNSYKQNKLRSFDQNEWASSYCNVEKELDSTRLSKIKGTIPKDLSGCFYRNGPGRLERNGQWVHHPFDGDGMIASFNFDGGDVYLRNRFIRTKEWEEEEKAGKFLYRGVFGTQKSGGIAANIFDTRLKNIANTNVIKLGDDLLALWEAAGPYSLDPETLETKGLSNLNGVLKNGEAFSAHPRFDPGHNGKEVMVNFGVSTGPRSTIRLMEFETSGNQSGSLISERKDTFSGFAFLHDFAITTNWAIFLQNNISFNPIPFLFGQKGAAQCLSSKPGSAGKFLLIPRNSGIYAGIPPKVIDAPDGFVFHHLNASENHNKIKLESIYYKDFPSIGPSEDFRNINFEKLPEGILKSCEIDLFNNKIVSKTLSDQCCEFAMVNPSKEGIKARFAWMATAAKKYGNGPLQSIKKIDLINGEEISWTAAPHGFVGEPLMIPSSENKLEDFGWIIVLIWNGSIRKTELIILNAQNMAEQAVIELPIAIPHGLHGSWVQK
tara:strand:- start:990 stop:2480 length:1491 start_codon:yes stop_codon:yes gene_type:complete